MKRINKSLSIFMATVFVMTGLSGNFTAKAAVGPTISYVGLGHALVAGDTRTFTAISKNYVGKVQYRAFISYENHAKWTEITSGYTSATDAKTTFVLPATKPIGLGHYKVSVWVKADGTDGVIKNAANLGNYDSYKVSTINCANTIGATININNIVGEKTPIVGTTEKYTVTSNSTGQVQYKAFIIKGTKVTPLSAEYGPAVDAKTPFVLPETPALELGAYRLSVWVKRAGETGVKTNADGLGSYDNYAVSNLTCIVNPNASTDVKVFDTTVKAAQFGSLVNVTLTADGVKEIPGAIQYQIFDGVKPVSAITNIATATTVFPVKALGDKVNVKLFDATSKEVKTIEVLLGQSGTITAVPPVTSVTSVTTATVKGASFGALINVTSNEKDAVKYQVFNGTTPISDGNLTVLGTATTIFPGKAVGEKVNVKLMNAAGTVLATKEVTLVAAK